jgi:Putative esterase
MRLRLAALVALVALVALLVSCNSTGMKPGTAPAPAPGAPATGGPRFAVRLAPGLASEPVAGRLLVILATGGAREPRHLVTDDDETAQVFGVDVDGWSAGQTRALEGDVAGYPLLSAAELPAREYVAQALLHRYETFRRSDGHVVSLPPDRGEGQQWNEAPGNLVSKPQRVRIDASTTTITLTLDHPLPPLSPTTESRVRRVQMKSELLSKFWGRDMFLGAMVLLPAGWETHPRARYPLLIYHGHFNRELTGYRETPPDPKLPPVDREALRVHCPNGHGAGCAPHGYDRMVQEAGYRFSQLWASKDFPRVILVEIQHANPYYDDSYAVNSANVGPYGDAITHELVPYLEKEYRGLGAWARGMYGGSTGGWEALAAQIFYPDEYNGAVANCPDPIDFRAYTTIDIYRDANANFATGPIRRTPRGAIRTDDGVVRSTMELENRRELALGTRSRSGQQLDIWEAVYSPVGDDGYPRRIYDKITGVIDRSVAAHWRENYDLGHIVTRDWKRLGPKLRGKLRINVGNMDTYYLDRAVRLFEARLRELDDPKPDAVIDYGARDGHCWSGDHEHMNFESRLTYHQRFIPLLVDHFLRTAPKGADTRSWRY